MEEIRSILQISILAVAGETDWKKYGEVNTQIWEDLIIFNYSEKAIYDGRWNFFERVSRGLIINKRTGEIVARPFDTYFNWMEKDQKSDGRIVSITEKIDRSLGILYRYKGHYGIATRGSLTSDWARYATRFLNTFHNLDGLPQAYTLLFEIIYPDIRVMIDKGPICDLVILAIRNRFTGEYLPRDQVRTIAAIHNFAIFDERDTTPLIYRHTFKDRQDSRVLNVC
jgi:RNA ligase